MRLLDLFCGAGGAAEGYYRAGFTSIVGVDNKSQRNYPFEFVQDDALDYLEGLMFDRRETFFDAIHASPPCQAYSITRHSHNAEHPDLLPATRDLLKRSGLPYVIENVPGAPMPGAIVLCGAAFNLRAHDSATGLDLWLRRHRLFESNVPLMGPGGCMCRGKEIGGVYGGGSSDRNHARNVRRGGYTPGAQVRKELMGIGWMTQDELSQAIPPAYTEFVGRQVLEHKWRVA